MRHPAELSNILDINNVLCNQSFKGNVQFMFLCNPQKSSVNVCFMKILKSTVTKSNCVFYSLGEEKAVSVRFLTSIMDLFKFHHMLKGHFLNKLRVFFKGWGRILKIQVRYNVSHFF